MLNRRTLLIGIAEMAALTGLGDVARFDEGRLLVERFPSKELLVADNLAWLEAGKVPDYAVGNVVKWLELKGEDMSRYRRDHAVREPAAKPFGKDFRLGYMLDISRDKVPTMETLKTMVDALAAAGFGEFQLYTENTFAYTNHAAAWEGWSPMTAAEVRELDAYAWSKGVRLVPNQNSFGHLEKWLAHAEYREALAETPNGYAIEHPKLQRDYPCAVSPTTPKTYAFLDGLYGELLPNFAHAAELNVGCDEVWDIFDKNGRSAAVAAKIGVPQLYMNHLLKIHGLLKARGIRMAYWTEMVLRYPELLDQVPKDVNALQWGYGSEWASPGYTCEFEGRCEALRRRGIPYTVCPSTEAHSGPFFDLKRTFGNIRLAAESAAKFGAEGLLLTDWGDGGHPNAFLETLPSVVYAGLLCRNRSATPADVAAKLDEIAGVKIGALLTAYHDQRAKPADKLDLAKLRALMAQRLACNAGAPAWVANGNRMADLHLRAAEARAAGKALPEGLAREYRELWREANRPGGVEDSLKQRRYLTDGPAVSGKAISG